jgi:hypothetical protein
MLICACRDWLGLNWQATQLIVSDKIRAFLSEVPAPLGFAAVEGGCSEQRLKDLAIPLYGILESHTLEEVGGDCTIFITISSSSRVISTRSRSVCAFVSRA